MAAPAVSLADLGYVVQPRTRRPRVGSHRDLRPEIAPRKGDVIGRLRVEIVRDEFVISVDVGVRQVKAYDSTLVTGTLLDQVDGIPMAFQNRGQTRLHRFAL